MNIKKIGFIILLIITIAGVAVAYEKYRQQTGETYYVQLINDPVCKVNKEVQSLDCEYKEKGYDKEGNEKTMTFYSSRERALRKDSYLAVVYNKDNYVTKYEEVKKEEIPQKALEKLEKNKMER